MIYLQGVTVKVVVVVGDAVAVATPVEVAPALQTYDAAPVAVKVAVCPEQMIAESTVTTGVVFTVTVATAVLVQLPVVPVTV